ncbi:tetratricopeptide repeat protein [Methanococcoides alaskense]|uniref:Tetratricopeptide (TPR) repeat protein n=1 Tax=Methanococcoides alaskense TaxID=325778 RepID=A0AA90U1L9_9EURY|nr:tetratricopeptide repeat protein [Methanococcoides alaskense]MDA0525802.1 tetratricopeptide repeat protein [Methanococcoides alaskense]MDR6224006.1 tetratricopeptide (TPR) repeat protein [Methanococcoides alaskense]
MNHEAAFECFEAALQINPNNAPALLNKGITCLQLKQNQMALTCFNKLIKMGYRQSIVWKNKGIALSRLGDQPAAIASFYEALKLKPDDVKVQEMKKKAIELQK